MDIQKVLAHLMLTALFALFLTSPKLICEVFMFVKASAILLLNL